MLKTIITWGCHVRPTSLNSKYDLFLPQWSQPSPCSSRHLRSFQIRRSFCCKTHETFHFPEKAPCLDLLNCATNTKVLLLSTANEIDWSVIIVLSFFIFSSCSWDACRRCSLTCRHRCRHRKTSESVKAEGRYTDPTIISTPLHTTFPSLQSSIHQLFNSNTLMFFIFHDRAPLTVHVSTFLVCLDFLRKNIIIVDICFLIMNLISWSVELLVKRY